MVFNGRDEDLFHLLDIPAGANHANQAESDFGCNPFGNRWDIRMFRHFISYEKYFQFASDMGPTRLYTAFVVDAPTKAIFCRFLNGTALNCVPVNDLQAPG
jgi:hypothetical protein